MVAGTSPPRTHEQQDKQQDHAAGPVLCRGARGACFCGLTDRADAFEPAPPFESDLFAGSLAAGARGGLLSLLQVGSRACLCPTGRLLSGASQLSESMRAFAALKLTRTHRAGRSGAQGGRGGRRGPGGPAGGQAAPRVSEACVAQMQAGDPLLARTVQQLLELLRVFSFGP